MPDFYKEEKGNKMIEGDRGEFCGKNHKGYAAKKQEGSPAESEKIHAL